MPGKRNEEDKRLRLIRAVGDTLRDHGYEGLGLNKIALRAGVSKPMVYRYFDGLNGLLKAYIERSDSWLPYFESLSLPQNPTTEEVKCCLIKILQDQFRFFSANQEMQKLVLWQISEYDALMRTACQAREKEGLRLLELADAHFRGSGISLKAVMALLVGGIYFNVLHESADAGTMAGMDIKNEKDFEAMLAAIAQIIEWAFRMAERTK
jgi:AcrR family transcriptional regulator